MDALLSILQVWFECVEHKREFSMILNLQYAQGDLLGACAKVAAYFTQPGREYLDCLKAVAVITGGSSYYIDPSIHVHKFSTIQTRTRYLNILNGYKTTCQYHTLSKGSN